MSSACDALAVRRGHFARVFVLAALSLLAACATVGGTPDTGRPPLPKVDVSVPEQVAGFDLGQSIPHAEPLVGTQWRYLSRTHPELVADAYVYVTGIYPDDAHAGHELVRLMRAELAVAQEHGLFAELEYLGEQERTARTQSGPITGQHLRFAFQRDGEEYISHAHLFYVPPYTVKFRSTFPAYGNASFDERIGALVDGFLLELTIAESIRCRKPTVHGAPEGRGNWVSKDGRDIVISANSEREQLEALLREAIDRAERHGCPLPSAGGD